MRVVERFHAHGHEQIRATHRTTMEFTREETLSERGDCIVAVGATKGAADLSPKFKELAGRDDARVTIIIEVDGLSEVVNAHGRSGLTFTHPTDMVIRRSLYTCGRTIAVGADKAAVDISRDVVRRLQSPDARVKVTLIAEV